jgi:methionyl-tRNA formyltransferase
MPEPDPPPILLFPDPHLRTKARPVGPADTDAVRDLAPRMLEAMYRAPGIGLAAPQVGVGLRLVVVDLQRDETRTPMVLVNPEVVAASVEEAVREEGCLSLPGHYADVSRPRGSSCATTTCPAPGRRWRPTGCSPPASSTRWTTRRGAVRDHLSPLKRNMILRRIAKERKAAGAGNERAADGGTATAPRLPGSPDFSVPTLRALTRRGTRSRPFTASRPRPAGRGKHEARCPIHRLAEEELGLPVRTPARLRGNAAEHAFFAALGLDAAVVVAYGLILPPAMLEAPRRGCLNVHASLLPRWRGRGADPRRPSWPGTRKPASRSCGWTRGWTPGPVLLARAVPIGPRATTPELHDALAALGANGAGGAGRRSAGPPAAGGGRHLRAQALQGGRQARLDAGRRVPRPAGARRSSPGPAPSSSTTGPPSACWKAEPVAAGSDAPPGTVLDALPTVACGDGGALRLLRLQRPGRAPMAAEEFLRGYALPPGTVLG